MDIPTRVKFCSGYTGRVYEIAYEGHDIASSKTEAALDWWKKSPGHNAIILDPKNTTFSGAQMAYGGNDRDRVPAYYTVVFGDH